ncbi:conserved hypothetical protein, partial [Trichinella spiralis]|uniref:hypothetical protein n=1 Tax=Trichinella spiralis TaxID=6334 RepID=UPI0001EFB546
YGANTVSQQRKQKNNLLNIFMSRNRKVLDNSSASLILQCLQKENMLRKEDFYKSYNIGILMSRFSGKLNLKYTLWCMNENDKAVTRINNYGFGSTYRVTFTDCWGSLHED